MTRLNYRIGVAGASSLLGKEIAEELAAGPLAGSDVVLLDDPSENGKLEELGGEATFIQGIEPAAFEDLDIAIFASPTIADQFLKVARQFGVAIVDATGKLTGVPVRSPQLNESFATLDLETAAIAAAHPVTTMLAAPLGRLRKQIGIEAAYATILQPASESGAAALDEMHRQTVSLLSFQDVPKVEFDEQAAFNLLPRFGEDARATPLTDLQSRVARELQDLLPDAPATVTQWAQAPVFHGYAVSLFVRLAQELPAETVEAALSVETLDMLTGKGAAASNVTAAGQGRILTELSIQGRDLSLWLVADNLKLMSQTCVGCAIELSRLRPLGAVQ